jgi:hypothetical protein
MRSIDQRLVATLTEKLGVVPRKVEYDAEGHLIKPNLGGQRLSYL